MSAPQVYAAIAAVTADLAKHGITKDRKNSQQGYAFRGIDDVYNALAPVLAERKLCVIPRMLERDVVERQTKGGGALFNVTVRAQFDFVSAEDGSRHEVVTYGEAMDSADKATNKAMSAAYKYAAFMTFCIPTEGDNDADATTHEIVVAKPPPPPKKPAPVRTDVDPRIVEGAQRLTELFNAVTNERAFYAILDDEKTAERMRFLKDKHPKLFATVDAARVAASERMQDAPAPDGEAYNMENA